MRKVIWERETAEGQGGAGDPGGDSVPLAVSSVGASGRAPQRGPGVECYLGAI